MVLTEGNVQGSDTIRDAGFFIGVILGFSVFMGLPELALFLITNRIKQTGDKQ